MAIFQHGGVDCRRVWIQVGYEKKSLFLTNMSLYRVLYTVRPSDVVNRMPPDRGKLVTSLVAVSGGVCWSRETDNQAPSISESCLCQEASTLRSRQQARVNIYAGWGANEAPRTWCQRSRAWCLGRRCPQPTIKDLGTVMSSPSGIPVQRPVEKGIWHILCLSRGRW